MNPGPTQVQIIGELIFLGITIYLAYLTIKDMISDFKEIGQAFFKKEG